MEIHSTCQVLYKTLDILDIFSYYIRAFYGILNFQISYKRIKICSLLIGDNVSHTFVDIINSLAIEKCLATRIKTPVS